MVPAPVSRGEVMVLTPKRASLMILRLLAVLLLGRPGPSRATGTWSVIPLPPQPSEVISPTALVVDAADDLYVVDDANDRIRKRDAQGNWSVIATYGSALGQVYMPLAL